MNAENERCPLCGSTHDPLMQLAERWLLAEIQRDHPEWTGSDGACRRCVDYYRALDHAVQVVDAEPPAAGSL
jgi:hypothetical protein